VTTTPHTSKPIKRDKLGRYIRSFKHWSLENFDDGYIDASGRLRVYFPGHPRACVRGYVMRSIVAFEAYNNTSVTTDYAIHHKDGNRLNDSKNNLEKKLFGEHSSFHGEATKNGTYITCCICGTAKYVPRWRLIQRKDTYERFFCSRDCFYKRKTTTNTVRKLISDGLKRSYREGKR
jgi:hypothetical protein